MRESPLQSIVTFRNSQGEAARGTLLKLERSTVVFEVYNPYSIVQLSEVLSDLTIRRGTRVIYQGRAIVSNLVNTGLMLIVSVKVLDGWSGLSVLAQDTSDPELRAEVEQFVQGWESLSRLRESFVLSVNLLRSFLGELHKWLSELDLEVGVDAHSGHPQDHLVDRLGQHLLPQMKRLFNVFEQESNAIPVDQADSHKACAQRDLHPLLLSAPFMHRTYAKPLGYAGDYEMMNMIQRDPAEGPTVYARLLNTLFLSAAIPQSVRNRTATLYNLLSAESARVQSTGGPFRVLNVGCGPALEIQRFLSEGGQSVSGVYRLLDFNEETLSFVRDRLTRLGVERSGAIQVEYVHESVHNLLKIDAPKQVARQQYDLVYCSGLFDYLSDKICARLLRLFYAWAAPGGIVYVTNMHPRNPDRNIMHFLMEWYLIYRDEERMAKLAPALGEQKVVCDETGVNVGLEIRKL